MWQCAIRACNLQLATSPNSTCLYRYICIYYKLVLYPLINHWHAVTSFSYPGYVLSRVPGLPSSEPERSLKAGLLLYSSWLIQMYTHNPRDFEKKGTQLYNMCWEKWNPVPSIPVKCWEKWDPVPSTPANHALSSMLCMYVLRPMV